MIIKEFPVFILLIKINRMIRPIYIYIYNKWLHGDLFH